MLRTLPLLLTAVALTFAAACSSGGGAKPGATDNLTPSAAGDLSRSAEAGSVTVDATWLTEDGLGDVDADLSAYPLDEFVLVKIAFTTHSGDLNKIDMKAASGLKQGDASGLPAAWVSESDDSHHRSGVLVFPRRGEGGPAELSVTIDDTPVVLSWQFPPKT